MTKTCTQCATDKPASEFKADPRNRDGLSCWCKACWYAYLVSWRARRGNMRRQADYCKRWRRRKRERAKARQQWERSQEAADAWARGEI